MSSNANNWEHVTCYCPQCLATQPGYACAPEMEAFSATGDDVRSQILAEFLVSEPGESTHGAYPTPVLGAARTIAGRSALEQFSHVSARIFVCSGCNAPSVQLFDTHWEWRDEEERETIRQEIDREEHEDEEAGLGHSMDSSDWAKAQGWKDSPILTPLGAFTPVSWTPQAPDWVLEFKESVAPDQSLDSFLNRQKEEQPQKEGHHKRTSGTESDEFVKPDMRTAMRLYLDACREVRCAIGAEMYVLATGGLRLMVDILVTRHIGWHPQKFSTFETRIDQVVSDKKLTEIDGKFFKKIHEWGNKAIHTAQQLDRAQLIEVYIAIDQLAPKMLLDEQWMGCFNSSRAPNPRFTKTSTRENKGSGAMKSEGSNVVDINDALQRK